MLAHWLTVDRCRLNADFLRRAAHHSQGQEEDERQINQEKRVVYQSVSQRGHHTGHKTQGQRALVWALIPGAGHGGPVFFEGENRAAVVRFLERYL